MFFVRALDVGHGKGHHHAVRMPRRLLIDRVDQIECMSGEVALVGLRFHPDGEELRAEIAAAGLIEADMPNVFGIGRSHVEAFVEKALGRVGMGVDNEGGIVNGASLGADRFIRWGRGLGGRR
jgi:hypothetical protein